MKNITILLSFLLCINFNYYAQWTAVNDTLCLNQSDPINYNVRGNDIISPQAVFNYTSDFTSFFYPEEDCFLIDSNGDIQYDPNSNGDCCGIHNLYYESAYSDSIGGEVNNFHFAFVNIKVDCKPDCALINLEDTIQNNSCLSVCEFSPTTLYVPYNPTSTYNWAVTGGSTSLGSNAAEINVLWGGNGFGNITLTITDQSNNIQAISQCVDILLGPTANFSSNVLVGLNTPVPFTNLSVNADDYFWDFGDGNTSSNQNPTNTYTTAGTYQVTLVANKFNYDALGNPLCCCTDTITKTITVDPIPCPNIYWVSTLCEGDSAKYWTDATNCANYNWSVLDNNGVPIPFQQQGNDTICVQWNNADFGTIILDVSGCDSTYCNFPTSVVVPIISNNSSISGDIDVCAGETEAYTVPKWTNADYTWSVLDANNNPVPFSGQGSHQISVNWQVVGPSTIHVDYTSDFLANLPNQNGSGCVGFADLTVVVKPKFTLTQGPKTVCVNDVSNIVATSTPSSSYTWTVTPSATITGGGSNISVTWDSGPGTYFVKAVSNTPTAYCNLEETIVFQVEDIIPPDPIQGITDICPVDAYTYQVSQNTPGTGYNWAVTNGTPATGTGTSITVVWNGSGSISVYQYLLNQPGCNSNSNTLNVIEKSINGPLSIIGTDACTNSLETYSLSPAQHTDAIVNWTITPPNIGSVINGQGDDIIQVQWNDSSVPVTASISAVVELCGNMLSVSQAFTINPPVFPVITQSNTLCPNGSVTLSTNVPFSSYLWNTAATTPSITASAPGQYSVETIDVNGCEAISYYNLSEASIDPLLTSSNGNILCLNPGGGSTTIIAESDPDYNYMWFCGGILQPSQTLNTFTHPNTNVMASFPYYVDIVNTSNGCTQTSNIYTVVQDSCIIDPIPPCTPEAYTLGFVSALSNVPFCDEYTFTPNITNGTIVSWYFDDGTSSTLNSPTHKFEAAGCYDVVLTISVPELNEPGSFCTVSVTNQICIDLAADFSTAVNCLNVQFTDQSSTIASNFISAWSWDFGSPAQSPLHTFPPGPQTATLTVTDNNGCMASVTKSFTVEGAFILSISTTPPIAICENDPISFSAITTNVDTYTWDFGDGAAFVGPNPSHTYVLAGTYNGTLTVSNINGCTDVKPFSITVFPAIPPHTISPGNQTICSSDFATFTAPPGYSYSWLPNGEITQSITINTPGNYSVILTDGNGCLSELSDVILEVIQAPIPSISGNLVICDANCTNLSGPSGIGLSYQWVDSNGPLANTAQITVCAGSINNPYFLTVTDVNNCSATSSPVSLNSASSPIFSVTATPSACAGQPVNLDVNPVDPLLTYQWNHGPTGPSIIETVAGTYTVIGTNNTTGCSHSETVVINPLPDLCSIPAGCYTVCDPDTVCAPAGHSNYQWYKDGLPFNGIPGMNNCINVTQPGNYIVEVTNAFNCTATSDDLILEVIVCDSTDCDDLVVDFDYQLNQTGQADSCCATLSYSNNSFNLQGMVIRSTDADLNFDISSIDPSLTLFGSTVNSFTLTDIVPGNPIPSAVNGIVDFCIGEVYNDPQQVIIDWYDFDSEVACSDTLIFHCPIEPDCLYLKNDSIYCDNGLVFYDMTICNPHTNDFDVTYINFNVFSPPGIIITPPALTIPPLAPGNCFTTTVQLDGTPGNDIAGQLLCYTLTAHNANPAIVDTALCCTFEQEYCIEIPICDPCEYVGIEGVQLTDSAGCCYQVDIYNNYDPLYFDEIAVCVISPNTTITSINNIIGSPWITSTPTSTSVSFLPTAGTLPLGVSSLPEICFDTEIAPSQSIEIKWLRQGEIVCRDTTEIYCHPDCGYFDEESITCNNFVNGLWDFSGTLFNNTIYQVDEILISSSDPAVIGMAYPVSIGPFSTFSTIDFNIGSPGLPGDTICFYVSMRSLTPDGDYFECCYFEHCVVLPPCEDPKPQCLCDEDFYDHVNAGITCTPSALNPLNIGFTLIDYLYFEECDKVRWDFGDGSPYETHDPNLSVLHSYSNNLPYTVCATVYRTSPDVYCKEKVCKSVGSPADANVQFNLFPNPTEGNLSVSISNVNSERFKIQIFNLNNQIVYERSLKEEGNDYFLDINIGDLSSGLYVVKLSKDDQFWIKKISKL